MPTFIDYHEQLPPLPPEAAKQMAANIKAGKRDKFGVRPINVLIGDGDGYCITEAPDAKSVVDSHKAQGFPLRNADVKKVKALV